MLTTVLILTLLTLAINLLCAYLWLKSNISEHRSDTDLSEHRSDTDLLVGKLDLYCGECGAICKNVAHDTGGGWYLGIECENQCASNEQHYYEWPFEHSASASPDDLRKIGFEIV